MGGASGCTCKNTFHTTELSHWNTDQMVSVQVDFIGLCSFCKIEPHYSSLIEPTCALLPSHAVESLGQVISSKDTGGPQDLVMRVHPGLQVSCCVKPENIYKGHLLMEFHPKPCTSWDLGQDTQLGIIHQHWENHLDEWQVRKGKGGMNVMEAMGTWDQEQQG